MEAVSAFEADVRGDGGLWDLGTETQLAKHKKDNASTRLIGILQCRVSPTFSAE
jgi:hypothetical protein